MTFCVLCGAKGMDIKMEENHRYELIGGTPLVLDRDEKEKSFDEELNNKFEELFGDSVNEEGIAEKSPLVSKLLEIKMRNFANECLYNNPNIRYIKNAENLQNSTHNFREEIQNECHFTLPDVKGFCTLAFWLREKSVVEKNWGYMFAEELQSVIEEKDGFVAQSFLVERSIMKKSHILICWINPKKRQVIFNTGIFSDKTIKISKKLEQIVVPTDLEGKCELEYFANPEGALATIIDPETCKVVLREKYWDSECGDWKAKIKLKKNKHYFVFKIQRDGEICWKWTDLEVGHNYRCGEKGYPKDCLKAAEYLEKDNSASALYEISQIFLYESEFKDEEEGIKYLEKAAKEGNEMANLELMIRSKLTETDFLNSFLDSSCSDEYRFVRAAMFEKEEKFEKAFEIYYGLAKSGHSISKQYIEFNEEKSKDVIFKQYMTGIYKKDGSLEYHIYILLKEIFSDKESIILLYLIEAADKGYRDACYLLAEKYDYGDGIPEDKREALKYYKRLITSNPDIRQRVAYWLQEGIGCEKNIQNAREAYELLCEFEGTHKGIMNNLGWTYLHGVGCEKDYEKAKDLFEKAYVLGSVSSAKYLGDIYLNGYGCVANSVIAKKYYKYAAEKGDLEARDIWEKLDNKKKMMSKEVGYAFISYAHSDKKCVMEILERFQQEGIVNWYDENIEPGEEWDEFIAKKIKEAALVIAFVSKAYILSENCRDELKYAKSNGIKRILIYIEDADLTDGLELRIGMQQVINWYKYTDKEIFYKKLFAVEVLKSCKDIEGVG